MTNLRLPNYAMHQSAARDFEKPLLVHLSLQGYRWTRNVSSRLFSTTTSHRASLFRWVNLDGVIGTC